MVYMRRFRGLSMNKTTLMEGTISEESSDKKGYSFHSELRCLCIVHESDYSYCNYICRRHLQIYYWKAFYMAGRSTAGIADMDWIFGFSSGLSKWFPYSNRNGGGTFSKENTKCNTVVCKDHCNVNVDLSLYTVRGIFEFLYCKQAFDSSIKNTVFDCLCNSGYLMCMYDPQLCMV